MFGPIARLFKVLGLMALTIGFYFLLRLEFLLWNWKLFSGKQPTEIVFAFFYGLRFDFSALFSVSAVVLLWTFIPWPQRWHSFWKLTTIFLYLILHVPFLILNLVDTEFINFVGRRFTYDSLFIVNEVPGKVLNFFLSYWHLFTVNLLIILVFMAVVVLWMNRPEKGLTWKPQSRIKAWSTFAGLCLSSLVVAVIAIRGGVQNKPISFVSANVFSAPLLNNLVLNSTFTFVRSYGAKSLKKEIFFNDENEMLGLLNGSLTGSLLKSPRPLKKPNFMVIVLESFGAEYLGPNEAGKTYTPFLDALKKKSLVFESSFANGRRSIEGMGAIMAGIPALMNEPFISSHYTSNYFVGLGTLLSQQGYQTSFFHGGHNGTMFFDSFMQSAGVNQYFGAKEYGNPEDDDGVWGIWDEPFLQWMAQKLNDSPEPFFTTVFTLTSHQPYKVPKHLESRFPEGPLPILKTISYTDEALAKFFASIEKEPWFQNTFFILTADHTAVHYRAQFDNDVGNYQIPMILYHPSQKLPEVPKDQVTQQIDILPTILDFAGFKTLDKNFLGSSMFVPGDKVAVNYIDGRYILFSHDYWLTWSMENAEPQMFSRSDRNGQTSLQEPAERKEILFQKLKAHIQYFNTGMWDNKLYYPDR